MSQVITNLGILPKDRIVAIRENKNANSNFVISSLLGHCISEDQNIVLVLTQHTLGHFYQVGKRLGYDLMKYMKNGKAKCLEFLKEIHNTIIDLDVDACVRSLFKDIVQNVKILSENGPTTIIFDDISHLLDIGISVKDILMYIKVCNSLALIKNVKIIVNCHVSNDDDEKLSNMLFHSADLWVTVSALKTGISRNVTGSIQLRRPERNFERFYHYKLEDKDIKMFYPGKDM